VTRNDRGMRSMSLEAKREPTGNTREQPEDKGTAAKPGRVHLCDRCGAEMTERQCKIVCPNCGSRYDCSDLNIYFD